jgi:hypothetical protein
MTEARPHIRLGERGLQLFERRSVIDAHEHGVMVDLAIVLHRQAREPGGSGGRHVEAEVGGDNHQLGILRGCRRSDRRSLLGERGSQVRHAFDRDDASRQQCRTPCAPAFEDGLQLVDGNVRFVHVSPPCRFTAYVRHRAVIVHGHRHP